MKAKLMFAATFLVSGFVFGGSTSVETDYTIGVLPFPLASGQTEALISIPWVEPGTNTTDTSAGVAVTNLVKTAGLAANDMLFWYDGSNYKSWQLVAGEGGVLYWNAQSVTSKAGKSVVGSSDAILKRGQALLLERYGTDATNIYLVGQYTPAATGTLELGAGDAATPVCTLFATPAATNATLNATWSNVGNDDSIYIYKGEAGSLKEYKYTDGKWGYWKRTGPISYEFTSDQITAGTGAWYVSRGTRTYPEAPTTVSWPAAAAE